MKKPTLRICAAILLLALLAVGASCGEAAATPAETTAAVSETAAAETEPAETDRSQVKDSLPELNFDGDSCRIYYCSRDRWAADIVGVQDGDIVNDAVYRRNLAVEERLNVTLVLIPGTDVLTEFDPTIKTAVMAGDDAWDLISAYQPYAIPLALEHCFTNLKDVKYLDFSQPWWNTDYMAEITVGDKNIFFMMGDLSLLGLKNMSSVYFNKRLYENDFGDPDDLYKEVMDGKWTLDEMIRYTEAVYKDLNGDGKENAGDLFGFAATTSKSSEHFMYDAGVRSSSRDADGIPVITLNNERTVRFVQKQYQLYYETKGAFITSDNIIDTDMTEMFTSGTMLFFPGWLYNAQYFRDMKDDYGIIPFPKLDEEQEQYYALVHDGSTIYCSPITCTNLDVMGAVTEAMAADNYRYVTPAYFEVALKTKFARDEISSQIIDMIKNSSMTDFLYANNYSLNSTNIGLICRYLVSNKTPDFASRYAAIEANAQAALDKLIDLYLSE